MPIRAPWRWPIELGAADMRVHPAAGSGFLFGYRPSFGSICALNQSMSLERSAMWI